MRPRTLVLAVPLICLVPAVARAQVLTCDGRIIRSITISPSVLFSDPADKRFVSQMAQWLGNALSWQTRDETVRTELLFREGDVCDQHRLDESARVLRAQTYLRTAQIVATSAADNQVDIDVQARDEFGLFATARIDANAGLVLKSYSVTEENVFGMGALAQVRYDNLGRNAGLVLDALDRQVLGRNDLELVAGRSSTGPVTELSFRRAFENEFDVRAWRGDVRWREEPFALGSDSFGTVTQPLASVGGGLGLVTRTGYAQRRWIAGVDVSYERLFSDGPALAAHPADDSAAAAVLDGRFTERRRLSTDLIVGRRHVRYISRAGLDAVDAIQDEPVGYEVRVIGGRGWAVGNGTQRDWFALPDLYFGHEFGNRVTAFARGRAEGRYVESARRWEGAIAAGELFGYGQLGGRTVLALYAQGSGGWNTSTPFQLTLSSESGMRGYGLGARPVGGRVVMQAEHRYLLGTIFRAADLGTTVFVDLGRGWARDAPFAKDTPLLVAAGFGLRGAFPSGSRLTTRLDLAFPLRDGHGVELRLTLRRRLGVSSNEPADVARSRLPISSLEPYLFTRY